MAEQRWVLIYGLAIILLQNPVYSFICFSSEVETPKELAFAYYVVDALAQAMLFTVWYLLISGAKRNLIIEESRGIFEAAAKVGQLNPELSQLNPELSQFNPELSQFHPELSQLNPELSQFHPELSQLNPELSQFHPELSQGQREQSPPVLASAGTHQCEEYVRLPPVLWPEGSHWTFAIHL